MTCTYGYSHFRHFQNCCNRDGNTISKYMNYVSIFVAIVVEVPFSALKKGVSQYFCLYSVCQVIGVWWWVFGSRSAFKVTPEVFIWLGLRHPINFAAFDWIWADSISLYTSEFIRLLLSSVTSSLNTSNPVPLEAIHAHAITLLHHVSQMMLYALDHELFQAFSISFSSCHFGTGWS